MKKNLLALIFILTSGMGASAQSQEIEDSLQSMLNAERYEAITSWVKFLDEDTLSAKSNYFTGVAHFVQERDSLAVKYLKTAIQKDPFFSGSYFYLGLINEYYGNISDAKELYKSALTNTPENLLYMEHLADMYYAEGLNDSAFTLYNRIKTRQSNPQARIYMKIAEVFLEKDARKKALETYYDCLYNASDRSEYYNDCLYNIGFFEYEMGNYQDAALILETLHDRSPQDYGVIEKLVQDYMKLGNFNKVNEYRSMLYEAHKSGELPEKMKEKYVLDNFEKEGNEIVVYEYFEEADQPGDTKYEFVVLAEDESIDRQLFLQFSTYAFSQQEKFALMEIKDGKKMIYKDELFSERVDYEKVKETIEEILAGKINPVVAD